MAATQTTLPGPPMPKPLQKIGALLKRLTIDPLLSERDTSLDRHRKTILGPTIAALVVAASLIDVIHFSIPGSDRDLLLQAPMLFTILIFVSAYIVMWWTKKCDMRHVIAITVPIVLCVVMHDLQQAVVLEYRAWPLFVLVIDVFLTFRAPYMATLWLVATIALYILVSYMESGLRFGLYDLAFLPADEARRRATDCAAPPCANPVWLEGAMQAMMTFLIDFGVTRSFAWQVTQQTEALEGSILVARRLNEYLLAYDLDTAEACLMSHKAHLAPGMIAVYNELLENLRVYRLYLPDALFPQAQAQADDGTAAGDDADSLLDMRSPQASANAIDVLSLDGTNSPAVVPCPALVLEPKDRRVSLLLIHVQFTEELDVVAEAWSHAPEWQAAFPRYAATLESALDAVKAQRGTLDFFNGERMQASFNAFGAAANHAVNAMSAASTLNARPNTSDSHMFGTVSAVVTGRARVGPLGSETLRQPSVVGALPVYAGRVLQAACAVDERVLCSAVTWREARFSHRLELLLHMFVLGEGGWGTGREVLFALQAGDSGEAGQEWMYEVQDAEGSPSAIYGEAAYAIFRGGVSAAREVLRHRGATAELVAEFMDKVATAKLVDVQPRVAAARFAEGGAASSTGTVVATELP